MDVSELKSSLIALKYPDITVLTDQQISDIFNNGNIMSFLEWVLNKLSIKIPAVKAKQTFFADVLWKKGSCNQSEKEDFLKNASLDVSFS